MHSLYDDCIGHISSELAQAGVLQDTPQWTQAVSNPAVLTLWVLYDTARVTELVYSTVNHATKPISFTTQALTGHWGACCVLQDKYEVLTKQFASAGIRGLTDIITPANKDLSRWVLGHSQATHTSLDVPKCILQCPYTMCGVQDKSCARAAWAHALQLSV
jgi:hypothetical protein